MDAIYKQTISRHITRLVTLVKEKEDQLPDHEKHLLIESLYRLNLDVLISPKNKKEVARAYDLLSTFNSKFDEFEPIQIRDFAKFWSSDGYYYFEFKDGPSCSNRPILKELLFSHGFRYVPARERHEKKRKINETQLDKDFFVKMILDRDDKDQKIGSL